jgi:DNA-repair protein complementing XP-A cells
MTDTKGGFLSVEDDPFNKALHADEKDGGKPAHMTMKEWERHQMLKSLRARKEGPFEPGLSLLNRDGKKCRECNSMEIDWQWEEVFKCMVCNSCKDKYPEKYSLLTKTEAHDDYILTDGKSLPIPLLHILIYGGQNLTLNRGAQRSRSPTSSQ